MNKIKKTEVMTQTRAVERSKLMWGWCFLRSYLTRWKIIFRTLRYADDMILSWCWSKVRINSESVATLQLFTDGILSLSIFKRTLEHWKPPALIKYLNITGAFVTSRSESHLDAACNKEKKCQIRFRQNHEHKESRSVMCKHKINHRNRGSCQPIN